MRCLPVRSARGLSPAARPLAWLSDHTFGVYWVHVLVLDLATASLGGGYGILAFVGLRLGITVVVSLAAAALVSYLPGVRRLLM